MDYQDQIQRFREFHASGRYYPVEHRRKLLIQLHQELKRRRADIMEALRQDLGKSDFEASVTEYIPLLEAFRFMIRRLPGLAKPRRTSVSMMNFPAHGMIVPEPYGVALVCATWNYPLLLALEPLAGAIASGNSVVLKLSPQAPATTALISELLESVSGFEQVITVDGEVPLESVLKERFDYIFYTGSENGGRKVMTAASTNLTPVTLELGGKSPCIVCADANLTVAARRITWGKFTNAGQTCVAPDYLLVHSSIKSRLVEEIRKQILEFYGDDPLNCPDYPRIVNRAHYDRLCAMLDGYSVRCDPEQLRIAPTVIADANPNGWLMTGEIFGPILPVIEFSRIDEALAYIRRKSKPLALYCFGGDRMTHRRIIQESSSGAVSFNDVVMHFVNPAMPFGGVGSSGMGQYHGKYTFDTFSHFKSVMTQSEWLDFPVRYPPFRKLQKKLASFLASLR